jgi:hypothetical protein
LGCKILCVTQLIPLNNPYLTCLRKFSYPKLAFFNKKCGSQEEIRFTQSAINLETLIGKFMFNSAEGNPTIKDDKTKTDNLTPLPKGFGQ